MGGWVVFARNPAEAFAAKNNEQFKALSGWARRSVIYGRERQRERNGVSRKGGKGTLTGLFAPPEKPTEMCSVDKSMSKSPVSLSG